MNIKKNAGYNSTTLYKLDHLCQIMPCSNPCSDNHTVGQSQMLPSSQEDASFSVTGCPSHRATSSPHRNIHTTSNG